VRTPLAEGSARAIRGRVPRAEWGLVVMAALTLGPGAPPLAAQEPQSVRMTCAECHEGVDPSRERAVAHAGSTTCLTCHHLGLTNDPVVAAARREEVCRGCHRELEPAHVHAGAEAVTCTGCHSIHEDPPLPEAAVPSARCVACHESPHPIHARVTSGAPACTDCHTLHSRRANATEALVSETCASCHEGVHPSHPATGDGAPRCTICHSLSAESNTFVSTGGPPASATCASCHEDRPAEHGGRGPDAAQCTDCHSFADDPAVADATAAIAARCGICHAEELRDYRSGGHREGLAVQAANTDLPTCLTCHAIHGSEGRSAGDTRLAATAACVECHSNDLLSRKYGLSETVGASYTEDFHGRTAQFLWRHPESEDQPPVVMTCADCHGAHDVGRREDAVIADVCLRCHEDGDAKLAGAWLGHSPPGPRNNALVWLVRLFYYGLIPFVLIGLTLNIIFHLVDQRRKGARILDTLRSRLKRRKGPRPATVTRFNRRERLEHLGSMFTFILLVVTGLPQTRPDLSVARGIIDLFGGIATTRLIHRAVGVMFVSLLLVHVGRAVAAALRRRHLPVMVPVRKDFRDTLATVRHYLVGTPRPKVGKFDFSEKYEYWGMFLGGTLMSVTGLMLLFPELVTQLLPGSMVAALRVVHGLEATFAFMVVVLWHTYGVILRPEVFPMDTSIFTGEITVERLKEEYPLEYERLFPEDADGRREEPEPAGLPGAGQLRAEHLDDAASPSGKET